MALVKPLRLITGREQESAITDTLLINNVQGDTVASGTLTLISTNNATKGKILFGISGYDEVNNRLGIGTSTPLAFIDILNNSVSTLPAINSGLYIRNTTPATVSVQQSSPSITLEGQGWKTNATAASQQAAIQLGCVPTSSAVSPIPTFQVNSVANSITTNILNVSLQGTTSIISSGSSVMALSNTAGTHLSLLTSNRTQLPQPSVQLGGKLNVGALSDAVAYLHIVGSTTTAPHFNLTAGVAPTTPSNGDGWFNGTNLLFTRSGTTVENVFIGNPGATAPATTVQLILLTNVYGTATALMSTPNSWASVVLNGTTYKIPLYT